MWFSQSFTFVLHKLPVNQSFIFDLVISYTLPVNNINVLQSFCPSHLYIPFSQSHKINVNLLYALQSFYACAVASNVRCVYVEMANVGVIQSPSLNSTYSSLIKHYFMEDEVILHFLAMIHGISLSLRQLTTERNGCQ